MKVLSLQSWVSYGHVGNAAAMFPLQRLGAEVWAVHTVQFSNHTGYGDWAGEVFDGNAISSIVGGIARRGVLETCDAVLSGYLGGPDIGDAVCDAVRQVKSANPRAIYCCDPVIGDDGSIYVRPGVPELLRTELLPAADLAIPNAFELALLSDAAPTTLAAAKTAIARLQAIGPGTVLVSGLSTETTPVDSLDLLVGEDGSFHLLRTPRLPVTLNGTGDLLAALFLYHYLANHAARPALERAVSSLFGVIRLTSEMGSAELELIAAQEELIRPTRLFTAIPC
ncbi:MAG: pyridoxal kinase PdxY [Acetobacteraceae bacterium]